MRCHFATDLHGHRDRYEKLLSTIREEKPRVVLLGGDLLPHTSGRDTGRSRFVEEFLKPGFLDLRRSMGEEASHVLLILGNDDSRAEEGLFLEAARLGAWEYIHARRLLIGGFDFYGYSYVPPTPFLLKDWDRYDVSPDVRPGCISPEEGFRTVDVPTAEKRRTIDEDLADLPGPDLSRAVLLFHSPPYGTDLDMTGMTGVDPHVGSVAILRFIEERQPLVTLHGHVHESARRTGTWRQAIGRTHALSAAHGGPELALVRFDTRRPDQATRELI